MKTPSQRTSTKKVASGKKQQNKHSVSSRKKTARTFSTKKPERLTLKKPTLKNHELELQVTALSDEGRGVAVIDSLPNVGMQKHQEELAKSIGKKVFIHGALPEETVIAKIIDEKKSFAEAKVIKRLNEPSSLRVQPPCSHFDSCGGCQLQHIAWQQQLAIKENNYKSYLMRAFNRQGIPEPEWLAPIEGDNHGYRRKVRLGVRKIKDGLVLGFRQEGSNYLTAISDCKVLQPAINNQLSHIQSLLASLSNADSITHIEMAVAEKDASALTNDETAPVVMLFRHLSVFSEQDLAIINGAFPDNWQLLSQGKKGATPICIRMLHTEKKAKPEKLFSYFLPTLSLEFNFSVQDFLQVNTLANRKMVAQALALLAPKNGEVVVDLFSGLGNFSLPIAQKVGESGHVVGVEGSIAMCKRANNNAQLNQLKNCTFISQDLSSLSPNQPLIKHLKAQNKTVDAVLLDPPRAGAKEVIPLLASLQPARIVYISCNKATFVRDALALIEKGYQLKSSGVVDMFGHTHHLEVMAYFERENVNL